MALKTYPAPWDAPLILACRRCQKRLRKSDDPPAFAKLRKWLKSRLRKDGLKKGALHVIEIPCLKICPRGGIVVLSQSQLASRPAGFSILRSEAEMESFYRYAKNAPAQPTVAPGTGASEADGELLALSQKPLLNRHGAEDSLGRPLATNDRIRQP